VLGKWHICLASDGSMSMLRMAKNMPFSEYILGGGDSERLGDSMS